MKAVLFLALLGVAVCSAHVFSESEYQFLFSKWIAQHNKKYNHENFFYRYTVFKRNMDHIVKHNKKGMTYTLGMNAFGDMTPEEFESTMKGYNYVKRTVLRDAHAKAFAPHLKVKVPKASALDWRTKQKVTPVKNQQQCGSCWAFSSTGSLEGAYSIKHNSLVSFSEQQLVDCSQAEGNQGCNGGLMDNAFQYILDNGFLCTEDAYPYTAQDGTCQSSGCKAKSSAVVSLDPNQKWVDVHVSDASEKELMQAIQVGPVSIAIEADQQVFQFYSGGVLNDPSCGTQLDHGVLVVGYGTDADAGGDYWIVKNSWGAAWGEQGYIRLARGVNQCGMDTEPSYPVVA